jgi:hypothetical protein
MVEGYFVQGTMGICHDVIGGLDVYVPQAWKGEQDPCMIGNEHFTNLTIIYFLVCFLFEFILSLIN